MIQRNRISGKCYTLLITLAALQTVSSARGYEPAVWRVNPPGSSQPPAHTAAWTDTGSVISTSMVEPADGGLVVRVPPPPPPLPPPFDQGPSPTVSPQADFSTPDQAPLVEAEPSSGGIVQQLRNTWGKFSERKGCPAVIQDEGWFRKGAAQSKRLGQFLKTKTDPADATETKSLFRRRLDA